MVSLSVQNLNVWYGKQQALKNINAAFPERRISAIIGPSGCGKSTLLKSFNRLLELNEQVRIEGRVLLDGENIYAPGVDVVAVRSRIGLLAQKPFPLPMSIFDNVAYGLRLQGRNKREIAEVVEAQLRAVGLWEEVKDRLKAPATGLSGGQQQRLCLARTLAVRPEILLCDESTASLDPLSARGIEELLAALRSHYTILMVTHDIDQARRLADYVVFMWMGELIEQAPAAEFFGARHRGAARCAAQPLHHPHGHPRHRPGATPGGLRGLHVDGRVDRAGAGGGVLRRAAGGADAGVSGAADRVNATAAILTLSREVKLLTTLDDLAREQTLKATLSWRPPPTLLVELERLHSQAAPTKRRQAPHTQPCPPATSNCPAPGARPARDSALARAVR